jgi:hypothetical protein
MVLGIGGHSILDAVKYGFGLGRALDGFFRDRLAAFGRVVVLRDHLGLRFSLLRLAAIIGVAVAEPGADAQRNGAQRNAE